MPKTRLREYSGVEKRQNNCLHGVYWVVGVWMRACVCTLAVCVHSCCVHKGFGDLRKDSLALNHSTLLLGTNVSEF